MKNTPRFLIAVAALALFASAGQAKAGTGSCCNDGIAASPKVRQMLNERNARIAAQAAAPQATAQPAARQDNVAASPKVQLPVMPSAKQ